MANAADAHVAEMTAPGPFKSKMLRERSTQ